jgi:hypothetical protein
MAEVESPEMNRFPGCIEVPVRFQEKGFPEPGSIQHIGIIEPLG